MFRLQRLASELDAENNGKLFGLNLMFRPTRALISVVTLFFVIAFLLAAIQPWYSAHLYVPIQDRNYFTIDNRSAFWAIRIGNMGGLSGFDSALTETNPLLLTMWAKHMPFPLNWISDWYFDVQWRSPYFLMITPLYFPALILGVWLIRRIIQRRRNAAQHDSGVPVIDSPYLPPSIDSAR